MTRSLEKRAGAGRGGSSEGSVAAVGCPACHIVLCRQSTGLPVSSTLRSLSSDKNSLPSLSALWEMCCTQKHIVHIHSFILIFYC